MKRIVIHIIDRKIIYRINDNCFILETNMKYGKINNEDEFIKPIQLINKKNKINQKIIGEEITIIINDFYTEQDIKYLNQLLTELQYNKINIYKEKELIKKLNKDYMIIDSDYIKIYYQNNEPIYISPINIDKRTIKRLVNNYQDINKLYIIDYNNIINNIKGNKVYLLTNPYNFFIDKIMQ